MEKNNKMNKYIYLYICYRVPAEWLSKRITNGHSGPLDARHFLKLKNQVVM